MTRTGNDSPIADTDDPLTELLKDGLSEGAFPGAVAAVGSADETHRVVAVGDRDPEEGLPATRETVFDLASLTKPIVTATVALRLAEAGTLALSDSLDRHIPALDGTERGDVTLVELLTHTSGFQPYAFDSAWTTADETLEGLYDRSLMDVDPGERYEYSCLNYVHLAEALRQATGESLADLAREFAFDPAGMADARLGPTDATPIAATYDHEYRDRVLRGEVHDPLGNAMDGESGNAGLFATVDDVIRFARALLNDGHAETGTRLLSPATVARLSEDHAPEVDEPHSLGWRLARGQYPGLPWSGDAIGHTGYTGTSLWIDPKNDVFAVLLTNQVYDGKGTGLIRFRERFHGLVGAGRY
ncbi:serine hydrolase domain-containing protein [Halorussus amylolyticus]|uniref:serine hydrolase domain-containing protein n=1 Tax=Halorussus amylolyticus TaxID=1126242 RepID=UPI001EE412B3|nr:serine hydrolase domain-containing protein [Halorussus amylolyticus]